MNGEGVSQSYLVIAGDYETGADVERLLVVTLTAAGIVIDLYDKDGDEQLGSAWQDAEDLLGLVH